MVGGWIKAGNKIIVELTRAAKGFLIYTNRYAEMLGYGWLPHRSNHISLMRDSSLDNVSSRQMLSFHVRSRKEFVDSLIEFVEKIDISEHNRAIYCNAIKAYKSGIHGYCVFLCFSYIESLFRTEISDNDYSDQHISSDLAVSTKNISPSKKIAFCGIDSIIYDIILVDIIYSTGRNKESIEYGLNIPFPSRHIMSHGFHIYDKRIHAYNILVLAEYITWVVSKIKEDYNLLVNFKADRESHYKANRKVWDTEEYSHRRKAIEEMVSGYKRSIR